MPLLLNYLYSLLGGLLAGLSIIPVVFVWFLFGVIPVDILLVIRRCVLFTFISGGWGDFLKAVSNFGSKTWNQMGRPRVLIPTTLAAGEVAKEVGKETVKAVHQYTVGETLDQVRGKSESQPVSTAMTPSIKRVVDDAKFGKSRSTDVYVETGTAVRVRDAQTGAVLSNTDFPNRRQPLLQKGFLRTKLE